jgi:hypothetical protein
MKMSSRLVMLLASIAQGIATISTVRLNGTVVTVVAGAFECAETQTMHGPAFPELAAEWTCVASRAAKSKAIRTQTTATQRGIP